MYEYVTKREIKEYRILCSGLLTQLRDRLLKKEINTQFILIGSGARDLVMRNGDGPYDLDYNLRIISMPDMYWNNLEQLKELVRCELNQVMRGTSFSDGKDSTSVITAIMHGRDGVEFKFDLGIIAENKDGKLCRLIHDKTFLSYRLNGNYIWNEVPDSQHLSSKVNAIRNNQKFGYVRERYKALKNMYLERQDMNHPSFICYVEAVNEVYRKYIH